MKKALLTIAIASALSLSANAENKITAENMKAAPGSIIYLELKVANDNSVAGYQANISVDKSGLTFGQAVKGARSISDNKLWVGSHTVSSTSYNVLSYSPNCKTFSNTKTQGVLVIPITVPNVAVGTVYNLSINNGILSDAAGTTATCTNSTAKITVVDSDTFYQQFNFNGDSDFDIDDVQYIFNAFAEDEYDATWDLNHDGVVDIDDVQIIFDYYGEY